MKPKWLTVLFVIFFIPVTDQNGCHEYWPFVQLVVWTFSNMMLYVVYQTFESFYFYDQVISFHHRVNVAFQFEKEVEHWKDLHHSQLQLLIGIQCLSTIKILAFSQNRRDYLWKISLEVIFAEVLRKFGFYVAKSWLLQRICFFFLIFFRNVKKKPWY